MDKISYSQPLKDANKEWQINKDLTPKGDNTGKGAFLPRPGKERPTPYVKTNECDH